MNKQQAAEYLGVSVRTITSYISQGKIGVRYERTSKGRTAILDVSDVEELKHCLSDPVHKPKVVTNISTPVVQERAELVLPPQIQITPASVRERQLLVTEIAVKPVLRVKEAACLSGFSESYIRESISRGELEGKKLRGAWRIHRKHFDRWLENLLSEAV